MFYPDSTQIHMYHVFALASGKGEEAGRDVRELLVFSFKVFSSNIEIPSHIE